MLQISPTLALPPDAVTQAFGMLAMRGAGQLTRAEAEQQGRQWQRQRPDHGYLINTSDDPSA